MGRTGIDWNVQPLGQVPDPDLARRLGVSHKLVHYHRRRRGIPAARPRPPWTAAEELTLRLAWGYEEAEKIAARLPGRTALAVIEHGRDVMGLGSTGRGWVTQREVVARLGICADALKRLRRRIQVVPRRRPRSERGCACCAGARSCRRPWAYTEEQVERLAAALTVEMTHAAAV